MKWLGKDALYQQQAVELRAMGAQSQAFLRHTPVAYLRYLELTLWPFVLLNVHFGI